MGDQRDVTLGEVYRLCQLIDKKVDAQNGRVTALEKDAIRIKSFWTAGVFAVSLGAGYLRGKLGL